MKEETRQIIEAAHVAAQNEAIEIVKNTLWPEEGRIHLQRQAALDAMAEAGFGRFFMKECGGLMPVAFGRSYTDQEDYSSWHDWAVFNMDEVKAYLEYKEIVPNSEDDVIVKHNEPCPECGYKVVYTSHNTTKCYECRSEYAYRENDSLLNECENAAGLYAYSSGPGRPFSHGPWARITKRGTRVLVTASGGYDV